ncbi:MAG: DUF2382 domain-containing protein [Proteobacteria bacterium]|nr:MAG: DUF2382 domain-containing protein [Pseudomonadota bacterium]
MSTRTITALFESRVEADRAVNELVQDLGLDRANISLVAQEATTATTTSTSQAEPGFWGSLKEMFMPDDDRATYAEGVSRGGIMISVQAEEAHVEQVETVLERNGAVDLDEREAQWRQEGWTGATTGTVVGSAAMGSTTGTVVGNAAVGTETAVAGVPMAATAPRANISGATAVQSGSDQVIDVVEERLKVGKREATSGRVRVRSYVVETPVEEQVTLHQENVDVQRRSVDRPVTDADALFAERTIEAVETREEAVVAKEARVKEELVIRKSAEDQVETVRDTVRHTEVTVDDDRKTAASTTSTTSTTPVTPVVPTRDRI